MEEFSISKRKWEFKYEWEFASLRKPNLLSTKGEKMKFGLGLTKEEQEWGYSQVWDATTYSQVWDATTLFFKTLNKLLLIFFFTFINRKF